MVVVINATVISDVYSGRTIARWDKLHQIKSSVLELKVSYCSFMVIK
jgi:hypothetical protein